MPQGNPQGKYWCFTINNYTREDEEHLKELFEDKLTYLVFGRETGDSGTPHLQGYLEGRQRLRFRQLRGIMGPGIHLERRRGSAQQASEYCEKDGDFEKFGEISKSSQGKRTDLDEIKEQIDGGATSLEVAEDHFSKWVVYRRSFAEYAKLKRAADQRRENNGLRTDLRVIVLTGEAGTGKTRYVYWKHPDVFRVPSANIQWFDGYEGQEAVLFDDLRGEAIGDRASYLLQLLDIYPMQVPVKGGFVNWTPKFIYITSNRRPPFDLVSIEAPLLRRLHAHVILSESRTPEEVDIALNGEDNEAD